MRDKEKKIQAVQFATFVEEPQTATGVHPLDMLEDIPLQIKVELGRATLRVEEILDLKPGSIITVNKLAGEQVDLIVNDQNIAKAEVLVIDDNFGVRITEIVSKQKRNKRLNS